jgi:hypothetical protein
MAPPGDAPAGAAARVSAATIKSFAESLGIAALPDDVAAHQAADVEYRLRQIIQAWTQAVLLLWHRERTVCVCGTARREKGHTLRWDGGARARAWLRMIRVRECQR